MAIRQLISHNDEEESYFVSMTDILIGLLFIFIIMLMFFAMRFQQASTEKETVAEKQKVLIEDLRDAEFTRSNILENIKTLLKKEGIEVTIVKDEGILRLPEELLFAASSWEIKNRIPIYALGNALTQVLPCYTTVADRPGRSDSCPNTAARIEAIFIEGHADFVQFRDFAAPNLIAPVDQPATSNQSVSRANQDAAARRTYVLKDNVDLSAIRATNTFRELIRTHPNLDQFLSPQGSRISVYRAMDHIDKSLVRPENPMIIIRSAFDESTFGF